MLRAGSHIGSAAGQLGPDRGGLARTRRNMWHFTQRVWLVARTRIYSASSRARVARSTSVARIVRAILHRRCAGVCSVAHAVCIQAHLQSPATNLGENCGLNRAEGGAPTQATAAANSAPCGSGPSPRFVEPKANPLARRPRPVKMPGLARGEARSCTPRTCPDGPMSTSSIPAIVQASAAPAP